MNSKINKFQHPEWSIEDAKFSSELTPELVLAFEETEYHVFGDASFTLRVGVFSKSLGVLYEQEQTSSGAFVTAWNPFSIEEDEATNHKNQTLLKIQIASMGLKIFEGLGKHPSNDWPGEESVFALGISLEDAKTIGSKFGQHAFIWCGIDCIPKLIFCHG